MDGAKVVWVDGWFMWVNFVLVVLVGGWGVRWGSDVEKFITGCGKKH